jgi:DNA-binding winged helix-turn-helix (wHTH) protein
VSRILGAVRYRFGPFELDLARFELRESGEVLPLEPQVFSLLALLVENRERLVTKDELIEKIWDGRIVSESAVSSRVKSARQALGDDGRAQRFIRTVHGQGFRFVAAVSVERDRVEPAARPPELAAPLDAGAGERPSLAVLPFRLLGDAGAHATLAEALPDELIAELSRLRWLFVIARASSFRLRPDSDPGEIGRLLGARYALSGALELAASKLAVSVELVDTRDGGVVWADRFTGPLDLVHALRAELRSRILALLDLRIPLHEASLARGRVSEDLDAWSAYHLGLQHMYRFNRADNRAAAALFAQAVAKDPGFARAHAGLSFIHFQTAFLRQSEDRAGEIAGARRAAERGVELDPLDPFVNFTMGRTFWLEGDLDGGLPWLERATSICPNYAHGIYARAWSDALAGRGRDGRARVDLAMQLSPLDPLHYAMQATRALSHLAEGEDALAAAWAERAARAPGAHVMIAMVAVAAHALGGDAARAAAWAANVRERNAALTRSDFFRSFPMQPPGLRERVSEGLARFGL